MEQKIRSCRFQTAFTMIDEAKSACPLTQMTSCVTKIGHATVSLLPTPGGLN